MINNKISLKVNFFICKMKMNWNKKIKDLSK